MSVSKPNDGDKSNSSSSDSVLFTSHSFSMSKSNGNLDERPNVDEAPAEAATAATKTADAMTATVDPAATTRCRRQRSPRFGCHVVELFHGTDSASAGDIMCVGGRRMRPSPSGPGGAGVYMYSCVKHALTHAQRRVAQRQPKTSVPLRPVVLRAQVYVGNWCRTAVDDDNDDDLSAHLARRHFNRGGWALDRDTFLHDRSARYDDGEDIYIVSDARRVRRVRPLHLGGDDDGAKDNLRCTCGQAPLQWNQRAPHDGDECIRVMAPRPRRPSAAAVEPRVS